MNHTEHQLEIKQFINAVEVPKSISGADLVEALYTMDELGLWPDGNTSVSSAQALICWQLVERLRGVNFPQKLRM